MWKATAMKRVLIVLAIVMSMTGCTRSQINAWMRWFNEDPDAALEFAARPEIQAELTGSDGPQFNQYLADAAVTIGDCDSYRPLFEAYGLPVATFARIAYRESGCNHTRYTNDHDDLGGFLLGMNFRTQNLRNGWLSWCGATVNNTRYDPALQVRCAKEAYDRLGLQPWS
jgi:hypothetical protein